MNHRGRNAKEHTRVLLGRDAQHRFALALLACLMISTGIAVYG